MSRWKAAAIHLLLSALVGLGLALLFFLVWYPGPLFSASGGDRLILLIIGIDLVVGPLLTLIVFRSGKASLRFDLSCIALAQVAFLAYGVWTAFESRPAFVVFTVDRFEVVPANALADEDLAQASAPFNRRPLSGPMLAFAQAPTNSEELFQLVESAFQGKDLQRFPKYYRDYNSHVAGIVERAHPVSLLTELPVEIDRQLTELRRGDRSLGFYPVSARAAELTAIVDLDDGEVLAWLAFDPWSRVPYQP